MIIAQLTDLHIRCHRLDAELPSPENAFKTEVFDALAAWLPQLADQNVDFIGATGDLLDLPRRPDCDGLLAWGYRRLRDLFESCGLPYCVLPGNHDDADVMRRVWPDPPFDAVIGGWRVMAFWDEARADETLVRPPAEMARFATALADPTPQVHLQHYLIRPRLTREFVTHLSGCEAMATALASAGRPTVVAAGHVHEGAPAEVDETGNGPVYYLTAPAFGAEPFAYRLITLGDGRVCCEDRPRG